jgi:hypothetical protein
MTYMYSIMFVAFSGSHANALVFGSAVIQASTPPGTTTTDYRLQKLFATLLVGVVCLFQSLSRLNYIRFSDAFALYKVSFLSTIAVLGFYALGSSRFAEPGGVNGTSNLKGSFDGAITSPYALAIAMLDIMRVYAGYENVNFVCGCSMKIYTSTDVSASVLVEAIMMIMLKLVQSRFSRKFVGQTKTHIESIAVGR